MEVITFVKGTVPDSKAEEFEAAYEVLKKSSTPDGLIKSFLLHNTREKEYVIETVWESQEALEKMRSEEETPAAIALFKKVGVKPTLIVYNVEDSLP